MSEPLPEHSASQIRNALAAGNKIEAIRLYREFSGVGLAEAKAFVEQLERGDHLPATAASHPASRIHEALFAGNLIEAVKLHRQATGCGLAEAKTQMQALEAQLRTTHPGNFLGPRRKGCFVSIVAAATVTTVVRLFL